LRFGEDWSGGLTPRSRLGCRRLLTWRRSRRAAWWGWLWWTPVFCERGVGGRISSGADAPSTGGEESAAAAEERRGGGGGEG